MTLQTLQFICLQNYKSVYIYAGFMYAVDTVKSVILTMAASERIINIEEAVSLSRLEEEFQVF